MATYAAEPGPAWGWRVTIEADEADDGFRLAMWNVPPGGADERAVEALFRRVGVSESPGANTTEAK